ncbi:hypothetical protein V6617_02040 [Pelagibacterium nitratireducens]|uniref:Uncharacterized protein n=1 Tax=Pelagibacterium nitratireducens TaxID=1046114 RepID=A0ABZ2I089_9HYPH
MPIYRLFPLADPQSSNWDIAANRGEVLVRASNSGGARVIAASTEAAMAQRRDENDDVFSIRASAFADDKLYGVQMADDSPFDREGPDAVLEGLVDERTAGE